MSGSLIGALRVTLGIDTAAFEQGLGIAQKRLTAAGKNLQGFGERMVNIGGVMSAALTAPLVAFAASSVEAATESAAAMAQVDAALESMGPVAGRTTGQLQKAAEQLQHISTFDDDDILKSVTANLLTFGNVTGEIFDRAQLAALNLSARLGQDLQSSAIQLGKALNDPVRGITALARVGVSFTAQQKAMIAEMVRAGDTAGAQGVILGELEKQYGGAARAARDATPGADMIDAWRNFQETVGTIVAQILPPLTGMLAGVLDAFNALSPGMQTAIVGAAALAAAIGPVLVLLGSLVTAAGALAPVIAPLASLIGGAGLAVALGTAATAAAPFIAAAAALTAGWALFGDRIGPVLDALSGKLQAVLGPKLVSLFATVKALLTDLWSGPFGAAIRVVIAILGELGAANTAVLGEALIRIVAVLVSAIENGFRIIGDVFRIVAAILRGDFSAVWAGVRTLVSDVVNGWIAVLQSLAPEAVAAVRALYEGVKLWVADKLSAVWTFASDKIQALGDKFKWLWDVVVGHSYIPDLFDGIQHEAARFAPEFVAPLVAGIDTVVGAFGSLDFTLPSIAVPDLDEAANGNDTSEALPGADGNAGVDLRDTFRRTFSDGIKAALDGDLKGFFRNWFESAGSRALESILNTASDALFDLLSGVLGGGNGGLGGLLTSVATSLIGGRAGGGPVMANTPYIVGEKRAELFVPSTAGRIAPKLDERERRPVNDRGTGTIQFNFYGPVSNPQEVRRSAAQAGAQLLRLSAAGKRGI